MKRCDFTALRMAMVKEQLKARGITDECVLRAFESVPRELFVPEGSRERAYDDRPLSIGLDQTISQPYIVALMTQLARIEQGEKVLEVGTGSGYQAAILAHLGCVVYSIERHETFAQKANELLASSGYNVTVRVGDGTLGLPKYRPYDKIIVTAAARTVPEALKQQLKVGGILVIPVGGGYAQQLTVIEKKSGETYSENIVCGCVFVPLIGRYECKK